MSKDRDVREAGAALDAIYARLPTIQCRGLCYIACGPVPLTDLEARRLQVTMHCKPRTIRLTPMPTDGPRDRCVYLTAANRCSAYAVRPLICRVWGVLKMLSCMHGCEPNRWLTDREFLAIAIDVERLGGGRMLVTQADGLAVHPSGTFAAIGQVAAVGRPDADIAADAERTRSLRALHGGRILLAIERRDRNA
jgi:hypothetical protein